MNGPDTRAWSTPRTCWTLLWTTLRALVVLGLGVGCAVAFLHFVDVAQTKTGRTAEDADRMALLCFFAVLPLTVTGIVMTRTAIRRLRAGSRRWQVVTVQRLRSGVREWVHLIDDHDQLIGTLKLRRWISASGYRDGAEVWFAGDPRKAGLVALPGGTRTLFAYHASWYTAPRFGRTLFVGGGDPGGPPARAERPRYEPTPPPAPLRGGKDDESFPSPRMLRRTLAYILDVTVHVAIGVGIGVLANPASEQAVEQQDWGNLRIDWAMVVGFFLLASFVDRVLIQAVTHTTLGKAVFGLVVIDRDTGRYPRLRWLLAVWLVGVIMPVLALGNSTVPERPERYLLPAVRRRDVKDRATGS
ncbi:MULTISPECIES: RDD family protein [unclassified Nocardia]|uniref:RDD family protein n=1 Tax=unclassified Nocardia TaxID=2637762 RepID=UPI0033AC0DE8